MWSVSSTLGMDPGLELEDAKQMLRQAIRAHRAERSDRERAEAALGIAVQAKSLLAGVGTAAIYAARATEPGTAPLMELMHDSQIAILLPMLGPGLSRDWATYSRGEPLALRAPGRPPEPVGPGLGPEALAAADIIFTPALSVDEWGIRLGQGGGWFDRALAHARPGVKIFAIVFDDEVSSEHLPSAAHDRSVDGIVTPTQWRLIGAQ